MASACDSVSIKYFADGVTRRFSFPFTYMDPDDVKAFTYNYKREEWVDRSSQFIFQTPTEIEFTFTPTASQGDQPNVWIARSTDLEQMLKSFYPGSAIRAQDLNDNFDQLRLAVQEGRCSVEEALNELQKATWGEDDAYTREDQINRRWVAADDQKIATSDAIAARHDAYVQPNQPPRVVYEQDGKVWNNTDKCWSSYFQNSPSTDGNESRTWVAYVNTGPRGPQGPQGPPGEVPFPDAPEDGNIYGRQDGSWSVLATGSEDLTGITADAPINVDISNPTVPKLSIDLTALPFI